MKIKLQNNFCQFGDLFKCPICKVEVVSDLGRAHPDPKPDKFDIELKRRDA